MEVLSISLTKTVLNKEIKRYIENEDYQGAKSIAKSFGATVKDYDVDAKLKEIDKIIIKKSQEDKKDV